MLRLIFFASLILCCTGSAATGQGVKGWQEFEKVPFKLKYFPQEDEYFLTPEFTPAIKQKEGKIMELTGYYLPYELDDRNMVLISKVPFASCFFCGGSGPESVATVIFTAAPPRLKGDQIITVRGTLQLNDSDVNQLNFIIKSAELIKK